MPENVLLDVLRPHLQIVFCGTAAGDRSAQVCQYYAKPTNCFWSTLHKVGLTPRQLLPREFLTALDFGLGLTDLVKCSAGCDNKLKPSDYDVPGFRRKIERFKPRNVAFNGKTAASKYFNCDTADINFGLQSNKIEATIIWVLPSTSSAAKKYWSIEPWEALAGSLRAAGR